MKIGIDQLKPQMGEEQHTDAERHIGEDVGFISFIEQQLGNKPYIIEVEHHGHGQRRPHHTKHFLLAGAFVGRPISIGGKQNRNTHAKRWMTVPVSVIIQVPFHSRLFIPDGFNWIHIGGFLGGIPAEENPVNVQTPKLITMLHHWMKMGILAATLMTYAPRHPI